MEIVFGAKHDQVFERTSWSAFHFLSNFELLPYNAMKFKRTKKNFSSDVK